MAISCCGHVAPGHAKLRPGVGYLATGPLRVAESRLADATIGRRKRRILAPIERRETAQLRRLFRVEARRVLELLERARLPYHPRGGEFREQSVAEAVPNLTSAMDADLSRFLSYILNGQDVASYATGLGGLYRDVLPAAIDNAILQSMIAAGIGVDGPLARFPRAEQWIRANAIQFGERFADSVTETTNRAIRNQLAQGFANFESVPQLAKRVRSVYADADKYRAEVIVRTEANRAYSAASVEAYRQMGVESKFWIISGSEYAVYPEICAVNAERGTIAMADSFEDSSGDPIDGPPAHPNCFLHHGIQITTDSGRKPICEIAVGDLVLTHKGRYRPVTAVMQSDTNYRGPAVRIRFRGRGTETNFNAIERNSIVVTPEHPFWTVRGWVKAQDLTVADHLYVSANACSCGNIVPYWRTYCSMECQLSPETRAKISAAKQGVGNAMFGKRPHNYIDGRKPTYGCGFHKRVRAAIRHRDDNRCQSCGMTNDEHRQRYGCSLDVHHVDPYRRSKSNAPDNLVTLCRLCHARAEGTARREVLAVGGAQFVAVPVLGIEHLPDFWGEKRYNFEVAEDHSYVAKGIVTHNCMCDIGFDIASDWTPPDWVEEV